MIDKTAIDIYIKSVKKNLPIPCQDRKDFLISLRQELQDYATLQSDYDLTSLYATFGTPQSMATQFLETLDPAEVSKFQKKRKIFIASLIIALVAFIVVLSIFLHRQMQVRLDCDTVIIKESEPYQLTDEEIEEMIRQEENKNE